jgi:hypothetical protein
MSSQFTGLSDNGLHQTQGEPLRKERLNQEKGMERRMQAQGVLPMGSLHMAQEYHLAVGSYST